MYQLLRHEEITSIHRKCKCKDIQKKKGLRNFTCSLFDRIAGLLAKERRQLKQLLTSLTADYYRFMFDTLKNLFKNWKVEKVKKVANFVIHSQLTKKNTQMRIIKFNEKYFFFEEKKILDSLETRNKIKSYGREIISLAKGEQLINFGISIISFLV